jgi:multicomponent Na+:H+ antiporter subunit B
MKRNSEILNYILEIFYPFILIFGIYIIANGHITPGGGFQGGAVLSSAFICRYIISPEETVDIDMLQTIEKLIYIMLILLFTFFLMTGINIVFPGFNRSFLVISNFLIGLKVCCGLSIVFFRFVFYESR